MVLCEHLTDTRGLETKVISDSGFRFNPQKGIETYDIYVPMNFNDGKYVWRVIVRKDIEWGRILSYTFINRWALPPQTGF